MTSSKSSQKPIAKSSSRKLKDVSAFDLFYQLTFMSAMSAAGLTRSKTFEIAAQSNSPAAGYFAAINTLVDELRYDYPDACRTVGEKAKNDAVKSFLLRFSDALKSGEPLPDFLAREAKVQGDQYANAYERDLESLKKWSDAFSSILVSVALIVIINLVSTLIYQVGTGMLVGMVATAVIMGFFGAWILSRAAPQETMTVPSAAGSPQQRKSRRLLQLTVPFTILITLALWLVGVPRQWTLVFIGGMILPLGIISYRTDQLIGKKDNEISSFLRSVGGMATSTGTTLKDALTQIDVSSFPTLRDDVERLSVRLQALVSPTICWKRFSMETGSQLIRDTIGIFYEAVRLGGDPEHVGYLCSLFASQTAQLRAKRRLVASTFSWLTLVMHVTVAALMVFVLEIIYNFLLLMETVISPDEMAAASDSLVIPLASMSPSQLLYLDYMTLAMIILLAVVSGAAIIASDGGYRYKLTLYLGALLITSGLCFWAVPPVVANILAVAS